MNDPLAQLLARLVTDLAEGPEEHTRIVAPSAAWMRAHRDELLTALGGEKARPETMHGWSLWHAYVVKREDSVWVFGEVS